jgi:succinate dehydrogenase cytochrome b556 subunit
MVGTDIERVDRQKGGMWLWLLQRISAVFLLFGLMVHIIATHIFAIGELSYDNIGERLQSVFFITVDILLLAAAIFHGLNGARMVLLDYTFKEKSSRRILDAILLVFGAAAMVYGVWALWPWITT